MANELRTPNVNVSAVLDRGHVLVFDPSAREVHLRSAGWFWDQEVFDFIGRSADRPPNAELIAALESLEA